MNMRIRSETKENELCMQIMVHNCYTEFSLIKRSSSHKVNSQKQKPSLRCRPSMKKTRLTTSNTWIFDKRMEQISNYTCTNIAKSLARKEYIKSFIMASTKYWNQTLSTFIVVVREAVNHLWILQLNNACGGFVKRMLAVELRSRFGICQQPTSILKTQLFF